MSSFKHASAYAPLPSLLRSLGRAGWGALQGRKFIGVRATLEGLARLLPDKSAEGLATAYQIAEATGYSEKHIRRCLDVLEDKGLIVWHRGGIRKGKPQPSFFRVVKTALARLIDAARHGVAAARRAHAQTRDERISKLRTPNVYSQRHADIKRSLSSPKEEGDYVPHPSSLKNSHKKVAALARPDLLSHVLVAQAAQAAHEKAQAEAEKRRIRREAEAKGQPIPTTFATPEDAMEWCRSRFLTKPRRRA